jgi:dienelactone hydrolase
MKKALFVYALVLSLSITTPAQRNRHKTERLSRQAIIQLGNGYGVSTPAVLFTPRGVIRPRPLIIFNHAAGQTERQLLDLSQFRKLANALNDAGIIVAASRLTDEPANGYQNWGNRSSLDANAELYGHLVSHYSIDTERIGMIGNSMGGLVTLTSFPDGRIPVRCAALYYPVTSLRSQYDHNAQMSTGIKNAYGILSDGSNYWQRTKGHDPALREASDWAGMRLRFYGGGGDRVVQWAVHSEAFAEYVKGVALESEIVPLEGDHNSNVETTGSDLVKFFGRCFE